MALLSERDNAGVGAVGSFCILLAYVLISFADDVHRVTGWRPSASEGYAVQVLNLLGGGFAAASAYITDNSGALPLAVLETIWAAIALAGLVQIARARWSAAAAAAAAAGSGGAAAAAAAVPRARDEGGLTAGAAAGGPLGAGVVKDGGGGRDESSVDPSQDA